MQRNLKDLSLEELIAVADRIKTPAIASLRLFVTAFDSRDGNASVLLYPRIHLAAVVIPFVSPVF